MAKRFEVASEDVRNRVARLRQDHYPELEGVSITCLFVFGDEGEHVLSHQGYPALAVTKLTSVRDRAAGLTDVIITVDRSSYSGLTGPQCNALLDHELYHIDPVLDDSGEMKLDSVDRPKLRIRPHDRHFGWFDEIAQRHGSHSLEVMQASALASGTGQLYFDFKDRAA